MTTEREETDLKEGGTLVLSREEVKTREAFPNPQEQAYNDFLALIAADPNIEGVAISKIQYGGVYTDWFVRTLFDSSGIGKNSLDVTRKSYKLLSAAFGDHAGYASFWRMEDKTFDEFEAIFREKWDKPSDGPFDFNMGRAHGENLELAMIIKFQ